MDVTKSNFLTCLPQFNAAVKEADFIAFDNEFTGLHRDRHSRPKPSDTFQSRWSKVRDSAKSFEVIQLGVCTFRWNEENSIEARPFNFWIFPNSCVGEPDRCFMVQAGSLRFLSSCNFDFNKCFSEGISYLNLEEARIETSILEEKLDKREDESKENSAKSLAANIIPMDRVQDQDRELVENFVASIQNSLENMTGEEPIELRTETEVNSFIRRVIYQQVEKLHSPERIHIESIGSGSRKTISVSVSHDVESANALKKRKRMEKNSADLEKLQSAIGIGTVVKMISDSRKPIVGHNCFLDLALIMEKFIEPLPVKYSSFCSRIHHFFPKIIDTKHVLTANVKLRELVSNHSLGQAYETTKKWDGMPTVLFHEDGKRYSEHSQLHEAAYDAFITGAVLANCSTLLSCQGTPKPELHESMCNHLHLMRLPEALCLTGTNQLDRSAWLMVSDFPDSTKTHQILRLVERLQASESEGYHRTRLVWDSDTCAYVILANAASVGRALSKWRAANRRSSPGKGDKEEGSNELQPSQVKLAAYIPESIEPTNGKRKRDTTDENEPATQRPRTESRNCTVM